MTTCDLTEKHCVPCEGGVPKMSREEAEKMAQQFAGGRPGEMSADFVLADADHLQCGPHRSAELPCAQHIPAAQGHVVPGFKSGYLDSGATTQRQKQQHEECPSPDVVAI